MKFTSQAVVTVILGTTTSCASAFVASSFVSRGVVATTSVSATFGHGQACACPSCTRNMHSPMCLCPSCVRQAVHPSSCSCTACRGTSTKLHMSDEATEDEVPVEVQALDGIESSEEAHNVERPAHRLTKNRKSPGSAEPKKALTDFEVGETIQGKVKSTTTYGAFIDIGANTDALLHVSRMSNEFVSNIEEICKPGDTLEVRIESIDFDKGQVALTRKSESGDAPRQKRGGGGGRQERNNDREEQKEVMSKLAALDWDDKVFVPGEVVSTLDFGAFVRFNAADVKLRPSAEEAAEGEDEAAAPVGEPSGVTGFIDGLVHISSLTVGRAESVASICTVGDKVQVRIKDLDSVGGKASLSMIAKEDEQPPRQQRSRDDGGGVGSGEDWGPNSSGGDDRPWWGPNEMGAADWAESMASFDEEQEKFTNTFVAPLKWKKKKKHQAK